MTRFSRIFLALITLQLGLEIMTSLVSYRAPIVSWLFLLTFLLVFSAAYFAKRAGASLAKATLCALPFALIMFVHGILNFVLDTDNQPDAWSSSDERQAFLGYLVATLMITFALCVTAFLGAFTSRALQRRAPPDSNAV